MLCSSASRPHPKWGVTSRRTWPLLIETESQLVRINNFFRSGLAFFEPGLIGQFASPNLDSLTLSVQDTNRPVSAVLFNLDHLKFPCQV